jgi:putative nucleotidyltransferase with HDIG domain
MRRELLQKSDLVAPLPDSVVRLLGVLNQPETEPGHLAEYLQNDQVLVAKMLGMVNSPFYGLNRTVKTIRDAVLVLGFRGVRSLVLATSTSKFLQRDYSCYGHQHKGLWMHAASVAAGAKWLGDQIGLDADEAEELFVAGLLHDIGKMVLAPFLNDALAGKTQALPITAEIERQLCGLDHTEAGALVAAKWNLSVAVQEILKAHQDTEPARGSHARMLACVRIADHIAHQLQIGYLPGLQPTAQDIQADLDLLGIGAEAHWIEIRNQLVETVQQSNEALAALGG